MQTRLKKTLSRSLQARLGVLLLLTGLSACAPGQAPRWDIVPWRWPFRQLTQVKGAVVCIGCRLEEAPKEQATAGDLYELQSAQGQVVMRVERVSDAVRWKRITMGHRLWVRAPAEVWQQLTAQENLFQEIEITGFLSQERTLDIARVTVIG